MEQGEYDHALSLFEESLAKQREVGTKSALPTHS